MDDEKKNLENAAVVKLLGFLNNQIKGKGWIIDDPRQVKDKPDLYIFDETSKTRIGVEVFHSVRDNSDMRIALGRPQPSERINDRLTGNLSLEVTTIPLDKVADNLVAQVERKLTQVAGYDSKDPIWLLGRNANPIFHFVDNGDETNLIKTRMKLNEIFLNNENLFQKIYLIDSDSQIYLLYPF